MLRALRDVLLGADKWMRVKILLNKNTTDLEDAAVEFEWICHAYGFNDSEPGAAIRCFQCTIPESSGLFEWYKSLYGNNDKSQDEPAMICLTPASTLAAVIEHQNAPPPPLDKKKNMVIEGVVKDVVFGERVEWSKLFVGTYPVGIGKHWEDNKETQQLDVHLKGDMPVGWGKLY
ncbi:hypothetical protein BGZ83_006965 [Gryganskiella cystojenkinii]|nr:hypothetical protein BGZ83_006965 [Gryganskiella cystojenkinii]